MSKTNNVNNEVSYSDDDIVTLDYNTHMRQRFGMYVGADPSTHMANEVLDNSIDEAMNGHADKIIVKLDTAKNELTVMDNGRGIPNGTKDGKNTLIRAVSDPNTGGKFQGSKSFKTSGGLNGTGLKATNAISEYLLAISERDGRRIAAEFKEGKLIKGPTKYKLTGNRGTTILFRPDSKLLANNDLYKFKPDILKESFKMKAYLNKGITIEYHQDNEVFTFYYENGIEDFMIDTVTSPLYNMKPITYSRDFGDNSYDISFVYDSTTTDEQFFLYTNSIKNTSGTSESGFKASFTSIMNKFIKANDLLPKKYSKLNITGDDIRKGLKVCINCRVSEPLYSAQIKTEINNPEMKTEIAKMNNEFLTEFLEDPANQEIFKKIANRIIQFAIATSNVKEAQTKIIAASAASSGMIFSDKFIDCGNDNPEEVEFIVCEGKSALGSLRRGRIGEIQSLYGLRGKPKNAYGSDNKVLINNFELNEIMQIMFGTNNKKDIDYDKMRIGKFIIAADSDDDGLHIVSLMSMNLKEHFEEIVKRGMLYVACPPKYRITVNNKYVYFKNDYEFDQYKTKYVSKRYKVKTPGVTMSKIIQREEDFKLKFNMLKDKYSIPSEILSMILSNEELLPVAEYLDEQGIDVSETEVEGEYYAQGLLGYDWLDVTLTIDMQDDIKSLKKFFNAETLEIEDKELKETYECDIIDAIELIDKEFKFSRYRFKGLGETNPDELRVTTLDPETRDIIQVTLGDVDKANNINKVLFGNNSDLRKDFIQDKLSNYHEM